MTENGSPRTTIQRGAERLRHQGIAEPRREAQRIWSEITGDHWAATGLRPDRVNTSEIELFQQAIQRRILGEPLAYVTGTIGFRQLSLAIDRRALIPRPETEGLVELILERVRTGRVADVGTGSGCIALSLAQEGSFNMVVGIERSPETIALARCNVERHTPAVPVLLVQGDICESIGSGSLDALVSNPPYLTVDEHAALDPSVREWEPAGALVGGRDGLEVTNRLLDEGRRVVRPRGWLALEVDCSRARVAAQRASELDWECVSVHEDLFGRERYLLARRSDTR